MIHYRNSCSSFNWPPCKLFNSIMQTIKLNCKLSTNYQCSLITSTYNSITEIHLHQMMVKNSNSLRQIPTLPRFRNLSIAIARADLSLDLGKPEVNNVTTFDIVTWRLNVCYTRFCCDQDWDATRANMYI